jgi:hypothetical protein
VADDSTQNPEEPLQPVTSGEDWPYAPQGWYSKSLARAEQAEQALAARRDPAPPVPEEPLQPVASGEDWPYAPQGWYSKSLARAEQAEQALAARQPTLPAPSAAYEEVLPSPGRRQ